jgi:hypothetical protein
MARVSINVASTSVFILPSSSIGFVTFTKHPCPHRLTIREGYVAAGKLRLDVVLVEQLRTPLSTAHPSIHQKAAPECTTLNLIVEKVLLLRKGIVRNLCVSLLVAFSNSFLPFQDGSPLSFFVDVVSKTLCMRSSRTDQEPPGTASQGSPTVKPEEEKSLDVF